MFDKPLPKIHLVGGQVKARFLHEQKFENKSRVVGAGSDLEVTEHGPSIPTGQVVRRKVVHKKTKGDKLRKQNADRYKGYEENKRKENQDNFGFSDDEGRRKHQGGNDGR